MEFLVGGILLALVVVAAMNNRGSLKRYQELKSKHRFGGKRLPPEEQAELDELRKKYWWY